MNKTSIKYGIFLAILAACLYAISSPLSKILLSYMPFTLMAGVLYIGAGLGMGVISLFKKKESILRREDKLSRKELPYVIAMIVLDIAAPILLLFGLSQTTAANASLLNNFEIVATALIALAIFKEKISLRLWLGIGLVTIACLFLSVEDIASFQFSIGSLFIILACLCWGIENNCTRKISSKDPMQIVVIKGLFSGFGSLIIGLAIGERFSNYWSVFAVLGIGFVAYGLSIFSYVHAQRLLGAARTSAYYAVAPFIGTALSLIIFRKIPTLQYFISLALMILGAWLSMNDRPIFGAKEKVKNR